MKRTITAMLIAGIAIIAGAFTASGQVTATITGAIDHETWKGGAASSVAVSGIPQSVEEFEALREQLGREPQGAVALTLLAFEVFHQHGEAMGIECLKLCATEGCINAARQQLRDKLRDDDPTGYARPYQVASFIKGATPENGYNPPKPYVFEMMVDKAQQYQWSNFLDSMVLYIRVKSAGTSTGSQQAEVISPDDEYFYVNNCPGFYYQCRQISRKAKFLGL